jgi:hypothetical protein
MAVGHGDGTIVPFFFHPPFSTDHGRERKVKSFFLCVERKVLVSLIHGGNTFLHVLFV